VPSGAPADAAAVAGRGGLAAAVSAAAHRVEPVYPAAFDVGGTGCCGGHVAASVVSGNVARAAHRLAGSGVGSGSAFYFGGGWGVA